MGTFILKPVTVDDDDGYVAIINNVTIDPPTSDELAEAASTLPGGMGNGFWVSMPNGAADFLTFSCLGLGLYLDGSVTPTDTNNLPVGFTITDANVRALLEQITAAPDRIDLLRNGSIIASQTAAGTNDVTVPLGVITNLSLITSILGFKITNGSVNVNHVAGSESRIEGTYTSDDFPLSLNPSQGNVEPGQSITVTGPNAAAFEYAATQGDQVIPIIPKVIGPDEVVLEVPSPDPACDDCFDDCPECEDCIDACNEDLTGEACQECMDACLDCLVECMDDLEEGEDCIQSVDDPSPTNIVIICGTPGNEFTGSVPLGSFTILLAEASGIYQLVDGKEEDTLYSSERDGTTYDVKIPNPNGKTGFFRS